MSKKLTDKALHDAAKSLNVELAVIRAVDEVESRGAGFLPDGHVKILFERHKFHQFTKGKYDTSHPNISNSKPGGYSSAKSQYARFSRAFELDKEAAMKSASWGRYQIMGFNYADAGFGSVGSFVDAMKTGEDAQLKAFVNIIRSWGLAPELREHQWASFARQYNGPKYRRNKYDEKLAAAYAKFKDEPERAVIAEPEPSVTEPVTEPEPESEVVLESEVVESPATPEPEKPTTPAPPAQVDNTIPAIPPLVSHVPSWAKKIVSWGAGINLVGLGGSFAFFRDNPQALGAALNIIKWTLVGVGIVAGLVVAGVFIGKLYYAKLANDLNMERLRHFSNPNASNVDFSGWKGQGEVKS